MEENFFPLPAVAGQLENMVEARLHNDGPVASIKERVQSLQQELTQSIATPIYLVMDPKTGTILGRRDGSLFDEEGFADFLIKAVAQASP